MDIVFQRQFGRTVTGNRADADVPGGVSIHGHRSGLHENDAGKGVGILENRGVAEVDDLLQHRPFTEQPPQWLAIARPQPLVGDNQAEFPSGCQQFQAAFVEIHIQVSNAVIGRIPLRQIRLERPQHLLTHIGRVTDHHIKAAVREHVGKGQPPVERPEMVGKCRESALGIIRDLRQFPAGVSQQTTVEQRFQIVRHTKFSLLSIFQ